MPDKDQIPHGYRQAITTAITVFLGFSVTFLRAVWSYEEKVGWNSWEIVSELFIAFGIFFEMAALFRAIDLIDDDIYRYRYTAKLFKLGVVTVIFGIILSISLK
jgi:hypothetical protein